MKISALSLKNSICNVPIFKKNDDNWRVFGYDEGGSATRDYIRNWQTKNYIPYQDIYEKETIKSEYDLNQLLNQFHRKTGIVKNKSMTKIGLENLEQLENSNSYRGAMIRGYDTDKISQLKDAGIKRIASLMKSPELEKNCKEQGLEYLHYDLDFKDTCFENIQDIENKSRAFWQIFHKNNNDNNILETFVKKDIENWSTNTREPIERSIQFINYMQKDNIYLGCACGTYRTDLAVLLNSLFNPKANYNCSFPINKEHLKPMENLFNNLTHNDKLKLGWTKDYEKSFISKLNKLKLK